MVVHWKDQSWSWNSNNLATLCKELTHWKRPWCWERLKAGKEGTTEDEMVGGHHQLNEHGFGCTLGVGDGQGGLVCCGSWGRKQSEMTELNWEMVFKTDSLFSGFSCDSAGKESACNAGYLGYIPRLVRSLEKGKAIHSSVLAWRIQSTILYNPWDCTESDKTEWLTLSLSLSLCYRHYSYQLKIITWMHRHLFLFCIIFECPMMFFGLPWWLRD